METYKLKNPFTSIVFPLFGLLSLLCVYPYISKAFYLVIIPVVIIVYGSYIVYKITFRIIINDSSITISGKLIPWNKVQRIIEYKQMVESGSGIRKINRLSIIYQVTDNNSKTITITPKDIDKPVAIINSIKKRIDISST